MTQKEETVVLIISFYLLKQQDITWKKQQFKLMQCQIFTGLSWETYLLQVET